MANRSEILEVLGQAVASAVSTESRVAVAYSGGLDSSLIAKLASSRAKTKCYICAMRESFDALNAPAFAEQQGLDSELIVVEEKALATLVGRVSRALNTEEPVRVAYSIPLVSVAELCSESTIVSGCGADEVFGGYDKYTRTANPLEMMRSDLAKMLVEDQEMVRFALGMGKRFCSPFLSESVLLFSDRLPLSLKVSEGRRKVLLREAASSIGLRSHDRPKKAAQYSTGFMKGMRRQARDSGQGLSAWVRDQTWDEGRPKLASSQRD